MSELATFIEGLPKAELHLHLEGTADGSGCPICIEGRPRDVIAEFAAT